MADDKLPEVTEKPNIRTARRTAEQYGDTRTVESIDRMYPDNTERLYRISPPQGQPGRRKRDKAVPVRGKLLAEKPHRNQHDSAHGAFGCAP